MDFDILKKTNESLNKAEKTFWHIIGQSFRLLLSATAKFFLFAFQFIIILIFQIPFTILLLIVGSIVFALANVIAGIFFVLRGLIDRLIGLLDNLNKKIVKITQEIENIFKKLK